jgi:hypothetical protein
MEGTKKMEIDGKYRKCIILMEDKGKAQVLMVNKEFAPTRITQKRQKKIQNNVLILSTSDVKS